MSQQERKAQESEVVRRLTVGAGAAALGLAWYFTASATTAVPLAVSAQPTGEGNEPASSAGQLDDRVFVKTVHVPASSLRGPAGGVKPGAASATAGVAATGQTVSTSTGRVTSGGRTTTPTSGGPASAPASNGGGATTVTTVTAPLPPPPPPPTPAATTGGSTAK